MEDVLREIGLTDSETKVYLALLDLGDSTRGKIVNKSQIAGSKVYEILERLQKKGLVSIYLKKKVKHFKPANPKQIIEYLSAKKQEIKRVEEKAQSILPQLLAKFESSKEEQEVELFTGMKSMHILFKEQTQKMKKGETTYVIAGTKERGDQPEVIAFFVKVHEWRKKKGIKTKIIYSEHQRDVAEENYHKGFKDVQAKFIGLTSPVAINLYQDRTIIILFGKQISLINIKSQDIANSFLEYFNILWKQAKK